MLYEGIDRCNRALCEGRVRVQVSVPSTHRGVGACAWGKQGALRKQGTWEAQVRGLWEREERGQRWRTARAPATGTKLRESA